MQHCSGMWFLTHIFILASLNYLQQRQKTNYNLFSDLAQHLFMITLVIHKSLLQSVRSLEPLKEMTSKLKKTRIIP